MQQVAVEVPIKAGGFVSHITEADQLQWVPEVSKPGPGRLSYLSC